MRCQPANPCMRAQSRKGEAHLFTLRCLELNIRTPGRGFTEGLGHFRSAKGKDGTWTEYTFRSAVNRITRVWKPKRKVNTLTLRVVARDWSENMEAGALRTMFHNCSCQSANEEAQRKKQSEYRARKNATEGLIWPLREGREIWGVDGVFASIKIST